MEYYKKLVMKECQRNRILVTKWNEGGGGQALVIQREIEIPIPTNILNLGWCFHEIGHVVHNHIWRKKSYVQEYEAEIYALNKLKELGFKSYVLYEYNAKWHVIRTLIKSHNKGYSMTKVPLEITQWLAEGKFGINILLWDQDYLIKLNGNINSIKDIVLTYYKRKKPL